MIDLLKKWRRDLHQIPELGLQEIETTAYIITELKAMGYHPQKLPGLPTGCYVYIDHHQDTTIAFRSDIDALPINEDNDVDYRSTHEGCMHACGHDGHMAMLLGLAYALKQSDEVQNVNVLLLFQPAEESPGAAKDVVASGLLTRYHVDAIYGLHVMPMFPQGTLVSKSGALMAQCGEINVTIHGRQAHAGTPEEGIDSIVIAANIIQGYQHIVSRQVSPFTPVVLNIGTINGGQARNSVAGQVVMTGTLRCYDETVFNDVVLKMQAVNQSQEVFGCTIDFDCDPMYPPLINDDALFKQVQSFVDIHLLETPLMLAEDFAFYGKEVPSLFVYVGTQRGHDTGLHTSTFDFDESCLLQGVEFYTQIIKHSGLV